MGNNATTTAVALAFLALALVALAASPEPMPVLSGSFASMTTTRDPYGDVVSVSRLWRDATHPQVHARDEGPPGYGTTESTWSTDVWMFWETNATDMYRLVRNSLVGIVDDCKKTNTSDAFYYDMPYDTDSNAYRTCTLTQLERTQSPEPRSPCTEEQLPWAATDAWGSVTVDAVDAWVSECNSSDAYSLSSTRNTYEFWAPNDTVHLPKSVEVYFRYFEPGTPPGTWSPVAETTQVVTWDCFVQGVPDAGAFQLALACVSPSPSSVPTTSGASSTSLSPTATPNT